MANQKPIKEKVSARKRYKKNAEPLADLLGKVLDPICARRGFGTAQLITWWPDIVGAEYEHYTMPENIHWPRRDENVHQSELGARLTVRVAPEKALFLQHEVPQLLEKVNAFLGYRAVTKINLVQKDLPDLKPEKAKVARALSADEQTKLGAQLNHVKDEDLEAALMRLGKAMHQSN